MITDTNSEQSGPAAAAKSPASRRVVVFGGSGFIGSELVRTLRVAGMDVSVARRSDGRRAPEAGDGRNGRLDFVTADITDAESVRSAVTGAQI